MSLQNGGKDGLLSLPRNTLPPIIMEVENGTQKETKVIFQAPIFHFHDYGRKGKMFQQQEWELTLALQDLVFVFFLFPQKFYNFRDFSRGK